MNAGVEARPMTVAVKAVVVEPTLNVQFNIRVSHTVSTWSSFTPVIISVNGHSISAINPNNFLIGGKATYIFA